MPQGFPVHDALYSPHHGVVVLRLDDRLMTYDPQTQGFQTVHLPEPPLSFSELDGDVIVGTQTAVYRVDIRRGIVAQRLAGPVPAHDVALGDGGVVVVQDDVERDVVWWSSSHREEDGFSTLRLESRASIQQGEVGPVLVNRWLSSVGFHHLELQDSGTLDTKGCPQFYPMRSRKIWLDGHHVFLDSGYKLDFRSTTCAPGHRRELPFATRLPVRHVAALCSGPDWVALIQQTDGPQVRGTDGAEPGRHVEVIAHPFPKRLGTFPLPSLGGEGGRPAVGRHVFCDGAGGRVFVVLRDGGWHVRREIWGIATFDITPLEDQIEKTKAWTKLVH